MVGCPLAVAAVLSCKVQADRLIAPHLADRTFFDCCIMVGGSPGLLNLLCVLLSGLLLGCLRLTREGVPSRLMFRGFGRFMMSACSLCLSRMLRVWMSLSILVMFPVLGWSGLVLLRRLLLMHSL